MRVHPTLIPERRLLAKVDGVMNAVVINSDAVGSSLYYGPGAGALPTASAVLADLIDIARGNAVDVPADTGVEALPMSEVDDRVLPADSGGRSARRARESRADSVGERHQHRSGDSARAGDPIDRRRAVGAGHHPDAPRGGAAMDAAVAAIQALDEVVHPITRIRVETLDEHA